VRVSVLGELTVQEGDALLRERDLPGNQGRLVLAMLAVEHRHSLSRDRLADELWPERLPRSWETALRAIISKVRAAVTGAGLDAGMIASAFGCYQWHVGTVTVDLETAATALHTAEAQLRDGAPRQAAANATITCIICQRPLLPGLYNPWTLERRERVRDLHVAARQLLAEANGEFGDWARAAQHAQHGLELDPYRERLHQQLIVSRARSGDRAGAARVFDRYRKMMRNELGVEPTQETVAVFRETLGQALA
jgi:DNA-binding SARP family transcriptional activator